MAISTTTPIFIFSLPRSGSTLLQRILAEESSIYTVSEPWLLLPLNYILKKEEIYTDYGQKKAATGIEFLFKTSNLTKEKFQSLLREFCLQVYTNASGGQQYFLDKTPRYHLICEEIYKLFPNAKFIFLWRNPLDVSSSISKTWGNNKWNLFRYKVDTHIGFSRLISLYSQVKDSDNVISIRYEDLVNAPKEELIKVQHLLSLNVMTYGAKLSSEERVISGWGDKTGIIKYDSISEGSVSSWQSFFDTFLRKRWAKRYLKFLSTTDIKLVGYDPQELGEAIDASHLRLRISDDLFRMAYGSLYQLFEFRIFLNNFKNSISKRKNNVHHS